LHPASVNDSPAQSIADHGFSVKRDAPYRFSILLIDDMARIALERVYRITMSPIKEIDMNRILSQTLSVAFAAFLTLGSVGAIVTVPPAQAETPAMLAMPEIA
jgi:ABC-type arginine transport system permease subunit